MKAIDRLIKEIVKKKCPCVVGLDPDIKQIPEILKNRNGIRGTCSALWKFNKRIIDAVKDIVPAVKLQMAFYEQYGYEGIRVFQETVNYARKKGLVIIDDAKRNDIGNTAMIYAKTHLGEVDLIAGTNRMYDVDFITVNPYLGSDGIKPFIEVCKTYNKGIFVLCKTSNPSSKEIQDKLIENKAVYEYMGELISKWGEELIGRHGYSSVGAVVGATYPEQAKKLRERLKHVFFLVPGYGIHSGRVEDVVGCFDDNGLGAIINSFRGVIFAYNEYSEFPPEEFDKAARQAVLNMKDDVLNALEKYGKVGW